MSIESAENFLKRVNEDNEFKNQLASAPDKESRQAIIKSGGYDFSEEELNSVKSKISIEDLDKIAAAGCFINDIACNCGGTKSLGETG
jgi:predicted ribosomally synthesized peptide with nif11-like leader